MKGLTLEFLSEVNGNILSFAASLLILYIWQIYQKECSGLTGML